jgi:hypothetical protein
MFALTDGLINGAVVAAITFFYALYQTKQSTRSLWLALSGFLPMAVFVWFSEYLFTVSHVGYLGGYSYVLISAALSFGIVTLFLNFTRDEDEESSGSLLLALASGVLLVLLAVGYGVTYWINAVGTSKNIQWAALSNIKTAPKTEKPVLPDTDPNEMVAMDVHLAYTRAHSVLGSGGNNLGSYYEVLENEGTQQWVAGRNWFVFPLELTGWSQQVGFFTRKISCGAGYVAVPADDPTADVKVESNLCLSYLPQSSFSLNLQRYIYAHGYKDGDLIDPTMELDDNWHPYFTISYVQPAFVVGGDQVVKVLVVDPADGEIKSYAPSEVPSWVDRVNSSDMVNDWVEKFALYSKVPDYWNNNNAGQMKIDTIRMVNSHGQHQVWQVPLLANKESALSTNGIVLYDTREAKGTFYESEGASGLASSTTLKAAFENISQNTRQWKVEQIQWYSIKGVPTWMAIYSKEVTDQHQTVFAGIGFLDARDSNTADVKFGSSKEEALNAYYDYLSTRFETGGKVAETVSTRFLTGTVLRIGHDVLTNNQSVYTVVLIGDSRIFNVSRSVNALLPVVREGDSVSITFDESVKPDGNVRQVSVLTDATLDKQMKAVAHN